MTRVYRLRIEFPEGSLEPGWEPENWWDSSTFRWPRQRAYLSRSGADHAASVFREFGARVTVEPSNPVTWPDAAGGSS